MARPPRGSQKAVEGGTVRDGSSAHLHSVSHIITLNFGNADANYKLHHDTSPLSTCLQMQLDYLPPLASWLPGFLASWLPGFLASWLPGFLASWLPGFLASWLPGFLASWLPLDPVLSKTLKGSLDRHWLLPGWIFCFFVFLRGFLFLLFCFLRGFLFLLRGFLRCVLVFRIDTGFFPDGSTLASSWMDRRWLLPGWIDAGFFLDGSTLASSWMDRHWLAKSYAGDFN